MREVSMPSCLEAFIVVETTSSGFAHSCLGLKLCYSLHFERNENIMNISVLQGIKIKALTGDIHPHVCFCFPSSFIILLKAQEQKVHPERQSQYVHWQLSQIIQGGKSNWKSKILIQDIFIWNGRVGMHSPFLLKPRLFWYIIRHV